MTKSGTPFRSIVLLALASGLASLALYASGLLAPFELKAYDLFSRQFNPATHSSEIVLVQIDQQSIDALSRDLQVTWPWPRQIYAPLVDYLSRADALFVDLLFTEPSFYGVEDDRIFADALGKAGNVYLPFFLTTQPRKLAPEEREFLRRVTLPAGGPAPRLSYPSVLMSIPPLLAATKGGGNVMITPDPDGVYRRMPLLFGVKGETVPPLVLAHLLEQRTVTATGGKLTSSGTPLPLDDGRLLLRYSRADKPFSVISAVDLLASCRDEQEGRSPAITRDFFRGKKVIIGLTAAGLYDLKPTAVSQVSTGMHIHATLLDNIMHRNFMVPVAPFWCLLLMGCLILAITAFVLTHHSVTANLGFFLAAVLVTGGVLIVLFSRGLYLPTVPQGVALMVSMISAAAYSYGVEGRERRFVRRAFAQYMDETLVKHLLAHPEQIRPGGQRRRVTVFFADIAGFTTLAEKLPAEETARILHTVLNAFSEVIIAHHGVIDKYIGDCIMAFWGAPLAGPDDEANACRAALRCQEVLAGLNAGFRDEGLTEIAIRIGIHTGDAIVGNLGSDRLFDYTVIGDTVNLASRLESANKHFGTRILVSGDTLAGTGTAFLGRNLGRIAVKGKSEPVTIFTLLGTFEGATPEAQTTAADHARALDIFRSGRFAEAAAAFEQFLTIHPDDIPAAYYRDRCAALGPSPPEGDDWQIITLKEK